MTGPIVLAHSGGPRTTAAIGRMASPGRDVVTLTVDLGQGRGLEGVHERALASGAARAHVVDGREAFARDFVLPALRAGALAGGRMPLVRALGRAAVARHLVDIAHIENATTVAHGDARQGIAPSFEAMIASLDPALAVLAPGVDDAAGPPGSVEANLWGRAVVSPEVGGPDREPPEEFYVLTRSAEGAPEQAASVEIAVEQGVPVAINGVEMALVELIQSLETIAGAHGVGRLDTVEHDAAGRRVRVIYEAPAAVALHAAHAELLRLVASRDVERLTLDAALKYADLAATGGWFTPARAALDALVNDVQHRVTGRVRLRLHKGNCRVVGRSVTGLDAASADVGARA